MTALYTWGLVWKGTKGEVAMFNLSKAEAERIEEASNGEMVCRPIPTDRHYPCRRKLDGSKVHAV